MFSKRQYRIKIVTKFQNGREVKTFYPQYKCFFWWKYFKELHHYRNGADLEVVELKSKQEALKFIEDHIESIKLFKQYLIDYEKYKQSA